MFTLGRIAPIAFLQHLGLLAFRAAFYKAFIEDNICAGFRATRLALFNLDAVLLKLNIVVVSLLLLDS